MQMPWRMPRIKLLSYFGSNCSKFYITHTDPFPSGSVLLEKVGQRILSKWILDVYGNDDHGKCAAVQCR